jgi:hypothetical protein
MALSSFIARSLPKRALKLFSLFVTRNDDDDVSDVAVGDKDVGRRRVSGPTIDGTCKGHASKHLGIIIPELRVFSPSFTERTKRLLWKPRFSAAPRGNKHSNPLFVRTICPTNLQIVVKHLQEEKANEITMTNWPCC